MPLRELLQCLKRPGSKLNITVSPDPKRFQGLRRRGQIDGVSEYRVKFQRDLNFARYLSRYPLDGGASNIKSAQQFSKGHPSMQPTDTKWIRVVDSGLRNANGQPVGKVLADILDKFPSYELQSEEGSEMAIHDIESKLSEIASFEDIPVVTCTIVTRKKSDDTRVL